jgi:hypothetical protein
MDFSEVGKVLSFTPRPGSINQQSSAQTKDDAVTNSLYELPPQETTVLDEPLIPAEDAASSSSTRLASFGNT